MKQQANGFTLLELILATFIFALIASGVAGFAVYYFQNYSFSFEEQQAIGQAQTGMTTMIREIREARNADNGAWALEQTDDNAFVFYSDVTNDGRTDRIRYFIDGNQLKKGITEPTAVPVSYPPVNEQIRFIASFVNNAGRPLFTYYNGNWPGDLINNPLVGTNRLLNTRYVSVYVRINVASGTGSGPYELTSGVQIRSLKDNL